MNLRCCYARTLARPTFLEFSPFASFDFVGDFILTGNPNLQRTLIDNMDLRWEWYPSPGELISVSGFYKNFQNPIERVIVPEAPNLEMTYRNVDQAVVYGLELELRFDFGFVSDFMQKFLFSSNISLLASEVDINEREYDKIISVDPDRMPTRQLMGQSPYAVYGELAYQDDKLGLQASVSYNVFGPRLAVVGGTDPDVFEQPRHLLNFALRKSIGKHWSVRFRARNLLNPAFKWTQTYRGEEYIYEYYKTGRSFSLGLSYNL